MFTIEARPASSGASGGGSPSDSIRSPAYPPLPVSFCAWFGPTILKHLKRIYDAYKTFREDIERRGGNIGAINMAEYRRIVAIQKDNPGMSLGEAVTELRRRGEIKPLTGSQQVAESSGQTANHPESGALAYGAILWHRMTEAQRQRVKHAADEVGRPLIDFVVLHNRRIRKEMPAELGVLIDDADRLNRRAIKHVQRTRQTGVDKSTQQRKQP